MKLQYVRAFIVLVASLTALLMNMKMHKDVVTSLWIVLVVILVFYILGTIVVEILQKGLTQESKSEPEESEPEESAPETEETGAEPLDFDEDE